MQNEHKKYIIFGAGRYGEEALFYYGIENVAFFCDNKKEGKVIRGIEVIGFFRLQQIWQDYQVILAVSNFKYKQEMQSRLENCGIPYEYFHTLNSVLEENNFTGEYGFVNRSKNKEKLLMILAGYKECILGGLCSTE